MLKFFRKKRFAFLSDGSIGKYIKYGIGEILLVVLGILIALGINNWNIEKSNRSQEKAILKQLKIEYELNLKELDEKISMRKLMINSIEKLIEYADNGTKDVSIDTIALHFSRTKFDPTFDPSNGVTLELLNSGKLYLVRNETLKRYLTSWSSEAGKLIEQEHLAAKFTYEKYIPYLLENFDDRGTFPPIDKKMVKLFINSETKPLQFKRELKAEAFEAILGDRVIQNYIVTIGRLTLYSNFQSMDTRDEINSILSLIESEIKRN